MIKFSINFDFTIFTIHLFKKLLKLFHSLFIPLNDFYFLIHSFIKKINHNGSAASTRPPHYGCDIFT